MQNLIPAVIAWIVATAMSMYVVRRARWRKRIRPRPSRTADRVGDFWCMCGTGL